MSVLCLAAAAQRGRGHGESGVVHEEKRRAVVAVGTALRVRERARLLERTARRGRVRDLRDPTVSQKGIGKKVESSSERERGREVSGES